MYEPERERFAPKRKSWWGVYAFLTFLGMSWIVKAVDIYRDSPELFFRGMLYNAIVVILLYVFVLAIWPIEARVDGQRASRDAGTSDLLRVGLGLESHYQVFSLGAEPSFTPDEVSYLYLHFSPMGVEIYTGKKSHPGCVLRMAAHDITSLEDAMIHNGRKNSAGLRINAAGGQLDVVYLRPRWWRPSNGKLGVEEGQVLTAALRSKLSKER